MKNANDGFEVDLLDGNAQKLRGQFRMEEKRNPSILFKLLPNQPSSGGGRGGKAPRPRRIDEFHPRGSAGQREFHAPKAHGKAALPYRGKGIKHPK